MQCSCCSQTNMIAGLLLTHAMNDGCQHLVRLVLQNAITDILTNVANSFKCCLTMCFAGSLMDDFIYKRLYQYAPTADG